MRADIIIKEFLDARAYVSHTLVKYRLCFNQYSVSDGKKRLEDASVWPLVPNEIESLCTTASTLFGINSSGLQEACERISDELVQLKGAVNNFLDGREDVLSAIRSSADLLADELSQMYTVLDERSFDVLEPNIRAYLDEICDNQSLMDLLVESSSRMTASIRNLFETSQVADSYDDFWKAASVAYLRARIAIVSIAVGDFPESTLSAIRTWKKTIRAAERVVCAWAPSIQSDRCMSEAKRGLVAGGFESVDELLEALRNVPRVGL